MKKIIPALFAVLLMQTSFAGTDNYTDARQELVNEFAKKVSQQKHKESIIKAFTDFIYTGTRLSNKTDALSHRIIGYRTNNFVSGNWQLADSLRWTYSGNRGAVTLTNNSYDTKHWLWWNNNAIENKERHTYTRDANNISTTYLYEKWAGSAFTNFQQTTYDYQGSILPNSYTRQSWVANAWQNYDRGLFTYNADYSSLSETYENWQNNTWVGDNRQLFTYNTDGYMLTHRFDNWINNGWLTDDYFVSTLNAQNQQTMQVWQLDNGGSLVNHRRYNNTYDNLGNETLEFIEEWQNNAWVNAQRFIKTFDDSSNLLTFVEQRWNSGAWRYEDSTVYTYNNINNDYITKTLYSWVTNALVPQQRETNTFNGQMRTEYLNEDWNGSAWENTLRYTYTFDGNGLADVSTYQLWTSGNWVNETKTEYDFDGVHRNLLYSRNQTWNNNAWENTSENYRYYEEYTPAGIEDIAQIKLNTYPNPASNILNIAFDAPRSGTAGITITNTTGQTVMELKANMQQGSNQQQINATALSSGVYFVQVKQGDNTGNCRFIKQ